MEMSWRDDVLNGHMAKQSTWKGYFPCSMIWNGRLPARMDTTILQLKIFTKLQFGSSFFRSEIWQTNWMHGWFGNKNVSCNLGEGGDTWNMLTRHVTWGGMLPSEEAFGDHGWWTLCSLFWWSLGISLSDGRRSTAMISPWYWPVFVAACPWKRPKERSRAPVAKIKVALPNERLLKPSSSPSSSPLPFRSRPAND